MANLKLLWKNIGDTAALSGGNWTLPITKIQNEDLYDVARSNGLSTTNSRFTIDLGTDYALFQAIALVNLNVSVYAQIRVQCSNDNTFAVIDYDTGYVDFCPPLYYTGELDWRSGNWWWGRNSAADLQGYLRNYFVDLGFRENRYVRIIINDPTNSSGYIDVGRLLIGSLLTYTWNYNWGSKLKFNDLSIKSRGLGGRVFKDRRAKYRSVQFQLDWLTDSEAYTQAFEIERYCGTTEDIFVVPDLGDQKNLFRRSFLGTLSELNGIDKLRVGFHGTAYKIEETL